MSLKVLLGCLETIDILLNLDKKDYILLSEIQAKFPNYNSQNIYRRLEKLIKQGIVEKQDLKKAGKKVSPGGVKVEYRLSKIGLTTRNDLKKMTTSILKPVIDAIVNKRVREFETTKKDYSDRDIIQDFIMEFSEEHADTCDNDTMMEYQKSLKKLLERFFF